MNSPAAPDLQMAEPCTTSPTAATCPRSPTRSRPQHYARQPQRKPTLVSNNKEQGSSPEDPPFVLLRRLRARPWRACPCSQPWSAPGNPLPMPTTVHEPREQFYVRHRISFAALLTSLFGAGATGWSWWKMTSAQALRTKGWLDTAHRPHGTHTLVATTRQLCQSGSDTLTRRLCRPLTEQPLRSQERHPSFRTHR